MNVNIPIILCDGSGIVVFKNSAAVKLMPKPKRGANIRHLLDDYYTQVFDSLYSGDNTDIGDYCILCSESLPPMYHRALAGAYEADGKRCIMLVLLRLLQADETTQFSQYIDAIILNNARDIFKIVEDYGTLDGRASDYTEREEQIELHMVRIAESIFGGGRFPRRSGLRKTLDIIRRNLVGVAKSMKLDIIYECDSISENTNFFTDYSVMTIAQTGLAAFSLALSKNGMISCSAFERYGYLHFNVSTTLAGAKHLCVSSPNVSRLAHYDGCDSFSLKFYLILLRAFDYTLTYTLTDEMSDNLKFELSTRLAMPEDILHDSIYASDIDSEENTARLIELIFKGIDENTI